MDNKSEKDSLWIVFRSLIKNNSYRDKNSNEKLYTFKLFIYAYCIKE